MTEHASSNQYVVCPLTYELAGLRRRGVSRHFNMELCGMGAASLSRWSQSVKIPPGAKVWLAGLAGGLSPHLEMGQAYAISRVLGTSNATEGTDLKPSLQALAPAATITSVDQPLASVTQKAKTYADTQSDLVDMEAMAFAQIAKKKGWKWGVVKGISDASDQELPSLVEKMATTKGRPHIWQMAWAMASHPQQLPALLTLGRNARRALDSVAACLIASTQKPAS
jgi:adenosylhomocysteine nucleosidase